MSHVYEILKKKGNTVWTVGPKDTVKDALKLMAEKNVGAVLVLDGKKVSGVFSERDFARHSARLDLRPQEVLIKDMMTHLVFHVSPSQTTEECMNLMTNKHIRHLPVFEGDNLIGMISIGDVVKQVIEDHEFSITQLKRYVTGEVQ